MALLHWVALTHSPLVIAPTLLLTFGLTYYSNYLQWSNQCYVSVLARLGVRYHYSFTFSTTTHSLLSNCSIFSELTTETLLCEAFFLILSDIRATNFRAWLSLRNSDNNNKIQKNSRCLLDKICASFQFLVIGKEGRTFKSETEACKTACRDIDSWIVRPQPSPQITSSVIIP